MRTRVILFLLVLALPLASAGLAQDADKPTVAILRFGPHVSYDLVDDGFLSALMAGGMISEAEFEILSEGADLDGENIRIVWNDAGYDHANTTIMVEAALDEGADVLVAYSTPVTQAATLITSEMDEPAPLIFTSVYDPFEAGIARSSCVKPPNVAGVQLFTPYEEIVPLLLLQDPDIQVIGVFAQFVGFWRSRRRAQHRRGCRGAGAGGQRGCGSRRCGNGAGDRGLGRAGH